jgi:hypothetical protein
LQYELPGIGVLAFVALEWNSQEANPDCNDQSKRDCRQSPPCKPHELVVDLGLAYHESSYFDEKPNLATKASVQNLVRSTLERGDLAPLSLMCGALSLAYGSNR